MIKIGSKAVTKMYYGDKLVKALYYGPTKVYSSGYQFSNLFKTNVIDRANALLYPFPPANVLQAMDTMTIDLVSAGLWNKWDSFLNFAMNPGSITGISAFTKLDWKRPAVIVVNSGGLSLSPSGWKGNGSSGWINTNFKAFTGGNFQQNNASKGFIIADDMNYAVGNVATATIAGVNEDASESMVNSDSVVQRLNSATVSLPVTVNQSGSGLKAISRVDNVLSIYNKTSKVDQTVASSPTGMAYNHAIFKRGGSYGSMTIASAFYGASLTQSEMQTYRTIYNKYLLAIGLTQFA